MRRESMISPLGYAVGRIALEQHRFRGEEIRGADLIRRTDQKNDLARTCSRRLRAVCIRPRATTRVKRGSRRVAENLEQPLAATNGEQEKTEVTETYVQKIATKSSRRT